MKTESRHKDEATLELLDRLSRDAEAALEEADMVREYAEVMALLPYELEPVKPRAEVWQNIESRLATTSLNQPSSSEETNKLVMFPRLAEAPEPPIIESTSSTSAARDSSQRDSSQRDSNQRYMALAAALGFCLLGLGYLIAQTRFQAAAIQELRAGLSAAQTQSLQVEDRYSMVTRTARQYYPLRPVSRIPSGEPLYGRVWVCGQHQKWLLNVEGLQAPPAGYEYHFWFETENDQIDGGVLSVRGGKVQMEATSMPPGTMSFSVTLERVGSRPVEPTGEIVLEAQEAQEIVLGLEGLEAESQAVTM